MTAAQFQVTVDAPLAKLWDILLDEMENPEAYSNTIKDSTILERFANGLLRRVTVPDAEVREKLVFNFADRTIVSTLVGHPEIVGVITKKITADPDSSNLLLASELKWQTIDTRVEAMLTRNVKDFMMDQLTRVKAKAEARDRT